MIFSDCKENEPQRDPENLSVFLIYVVVDSKISLFLFVSNRGSPYNSISLLSLSEKDSKFSKTDLTLFIRLIRCSKNIGSAEGNELYLQSLNYINIGDSNSLENYV